MGGGVSSLETKSFLIYQRLHGPTESGWITEFSFSSETSYAAPETDGITYDFRRFYDWMEVKSSNGIKYIGACARIEDVTEVPASGYEDQVGAKDGSSHCYAIQLSDGTYAVIKPKVYPANGSVPPFTTEFEYRHQKNGTRNF